MQRPALARPRDGGIGAFGAPSRDTRARRAAIANKKARTCRPGGFVQRKESRSGGRLEQLRGVALIGSAVSRRDLLGQFGEFLGLGSEGFELLPGVRAPQLDGFRGRFHAEQHLTKSRVAVVLA